MLPAIASSPPNFFTPRRLPAESRPLRDEPPAFLCAISYTPRLVRSGFRGRGFGLGGSSGGLLGARGLLGFGRADCRDLQNRVLLAMAVLAAIVMPAALLEDDDLLALRLSDDFGRDGQPVGRLQLRT